MDLRPLDSRGRTAVKRRAPGGWRRWWARPRCRRPSVSLEVAEAYRRWSVTYADEPNELQRLEAELRQDLLEDARGVRTLEVGAGTGRVTEDLLSAGADVLATDLVPEMLLRAPSRAVMAGRICVARAEALPFSGTPFGLVVCALTLGHVADLSAALGSMTRALRPGGTLLITGFHPAATLRGWERSFSSAGELCSVEQHVHALDEYVRILHDLDCPIEDLQARTWEGLPVLFGLRARKAASCRQTTGAGGQR